MIDDKINWILRKATELQSYFTNDNPIINNAIENVIKRHKAISTINSSILESHKYVVVTNDPLNLLLDIYEALKDEKVHERQQINPITIFTNLVDREYSMSINNSINIYAVKTTIASNFLLKTFACRTIASVKMFYSFIDDNNKMIKSKINELHPLFDYTKSSVVKGSGKHKNIKKEINQSQKIRIGILFRLTEYVRYNQSISDKIIFINDMDECVSSAMNIIYSDYNVKGGLIDFLKLLIEDSYPDYTFKTIRHADFILPFDFKLIKYTCFLVHKTTKTPLYLMNIYNNATYNPIPCFKSIEDISFIHLAHPIIKLWVLYVDMFMIEHKTQQLNPHEHAYLDKMMNVYNQLLQFDRDVNWIGTYHDENYEKNMTNLKSSTDTSIKTLIV